MNNISLKKIVLQTSYLFAEKEETQTTIKKGDIEIKEMMLKEYPEESKSFFSQGADAKPKKKDENVKDKHSPHPDIKKVYRLVVSLLHPDKKPGVLGVIFPEVVKAYNQNKVGKILEAAFLLKIDLSFISSEIIDSLKEENNILNKEVQNLHKTAGYLWFQDTSHENRQRIVENLFNTRGVTMNHEK